MDYYELIAWLLVGTLLLVGLLPYLNRTVVYLKSPRLVPAQAGANSLNADCVKNLMQKQISAEEELEQNPSGYFIRTYAL
ncbi:hypothetical protein J7E24_16660, partial [Hymenobacter sp. ISL-91]|uniref:hypothetical protein n=1 Tax=Hymenobacter sp. ISL-91 TaxID=2819151 RepID=UPI001BE8C04D